MVTVENTTMRMPAAPHPICDSTAAMSSEPANRAHPSPMANIQQLPTKYVTVDAAEAAAGRFASRV